MAGQYGRDSFVFDGGVCHRTGNTRTIRPYPAETGDQFVERLGRMAEVASELGSEVHVALEIQDDVLVAATVRVTHPPVPAPFTAGRMIVEPRHTGSPRGARATRRRPAP